MIPIIDSDIDFCVRSENDEFPDVCSQYLVNNTRDSRRVIVSKSDMYILILQMPSTEVYQGSFFAIYLN